MEIAASDETSRRRCPAKCRATSDGTEERAGFGGNGRNSNIDFTQNLNKTYVFPKSNFVEDSIGYIFPIESVFQNQADPEIFSSKVDVLV